MAKYVGKRIVPKHCGYWDRTQSYEMECIVYNPANGNSYISRKAVPAGTDISQTDYWALCSDFNEQMYLLDQHVTESEAAVKADTAAKKAAIETRMAAIEARQDENVRASTDPDADYVAEVVDARLDADSKTRPSLGNNIRGVHQAYNNLADYLAEFTYENVLYIDGTLEIVPGTFYNKDGGTREWPEFDSIKVPVKKGDRYCTYASLSMAMYKGETCLGYLPQHKEGSIYYSVVTEDVDYIWIPQSVNTYGKLMFIKGSYYPSVYIQPGKKYTLLENREFLPVRGNLGDYDLNELDENGIHLLTSSHAYENIPDGVTAGFLFTLYDSYGAKTGMQLIYVFTTGTTHYRSRLMGTWRDWRNNTVQMTDVKAELDKAVQELHKDMRAFDVEDLLHRNLTLTGREHSGVTFTFDSDGFLTVEGTAESVAFYNAYASSEHIPDWLEYGKEYVARIDDPEKVVCIEVFAYNPDHSIRFPAIMAANTIGTFTIPDDSPGLIIRFRVAAGQTANARVFPSISEKYTPEEYYQKAISQGETDRKQLGITSRMADQIRTFHQYNIWECEKMEGGFKNAKNEWVEDDRFDCFFVPITNHDRYYFTRSNTSVFVADADLNILSGTTSVQMSCPVDGRDEPISFWCHEVPYLENGAFIETIVGKSTNGFLRSSSQNAFQPMFNIGRDRGEGKAYEAIFLGDTLISPDTGPALGTFYEDAIMLLGAGGINENPGYYTTGTLFIKKGTILDVTCTNLLLNIRGFTAQGIFYRVNQTRFEFPADFVGAIDYHLGSWNWSADIPDFAAKDEHFFIRVITPEEQKNNPWKGKIWYSYGTSISDIGIGDVVGNSGHSGK